MWTISELENDTGINANTLELLRVLDNQLHKADKIVFLPNDIQTMLVGCIGDMNINKKLNIISPYPRSDTGIGSDTIGIIRDLSYRTRHLKKIISEMDRIYADFNVLVLNGKPLKTNEKLSLQQYATLHDLAELNIAMQSLDAFGLITGNATLETLYKNTQRAETMIKHFDKTFNKKFAMPTGSIVLENAQDKEMVTGKKLGLFDRLVMFFITRFLHVAKGISVQKGASIISHILPTYKEDTFSLRRFLYSDIYNIKLDKLINKKMHAVLKQAYGEDWLKKIEEKYADIERVIHDKAHARHVHIIAEGSNLSKAKIATVYLQGGNKNWVSKHHENSNVRDTILGSKKWKEERRDTCKMLCSEFIGMTLIAAITELNDTVKKDLLNKGFSDLPKKVITSPISQREKMHLLT